MGEAAQEALLIEKGEIEREREKKMEVFRIGSLAATSPAAPSVPNPLWISSERDGGESVSMKWERFYPPLL